MATGSIKLTSGQDTRSARCGESRTPGAEGGLRETAGGNTGTAPAGLPYEDTRIKLSSVISDIFGKSGRDMLDALIAGQRDPYVLADLARGSMRGKKSVLQEALTGHFRDHHGYLLKMMCDRIDALTAQIEALTGRIDEAIAPFAAQMAQLDEIPGVGK